MIQQFVGLTHRMVHPSEMQSCQLQSLFLTAKTAKHAKFIAKMVIRLTRSCGSCGDDQTLESLFK